LGALGGAALSHEMLSPGSNGALRYGAASFARKKPDTYGLAKTLETAAVPEHGITIPASAEKGYGLKPGRATKAGHSLELPDLPEPPPKYGPDSDLVAAFEKMRGRVRESPIPVAPAPASEGADRFAEDAVKALEPVRDAFKPTPETSLKGRLMRLLGG